MNLGRRTDYGVLAAVQTSPGVAKRPWTCTVAIIAAGQIRDCQQPKIVCVVKAKLVRVSRGWLRATVSDDRIISKSRL